MTTHPIYIAQSDLQCLLALLQAARGAMLEDPDRLNSLMRELESATIVPDAEIPGDVVTLHTRMKLEFPESWRTITCQIVLPDELNASAGRISVFSPLGTALIGQRVHDDVTYSVRGLPRNVRIAEILYQPEAERRRAHASRTA